MVLTFVIRVIASKPLCGRVWEMWQEVTDMDDKELIAVPSASTQRKMLSEENTSEGGDHLRFEVSERRHITRHNSTKQEQML